MQFYYIIRNIVYPMEHNNTQSVISIYTTGYIVTIVCRLRVHTTFAYLLQRMNKMGCMQNIVTIFS